MCFWLWTNFCSMSYVIQKLHEIRFECECRLRHDMEKNVVNSAVFSLTPPPPPPTQTKLIFPPPPPPPPPTTRNVILSLRSLQLTTPHFSHALILIVLCERASNLRSCRRQWVSGINFRITHLTNAVIGCRPIAHTFPGTVTSSRVLLLVLSTVMSLETGCRMPAGEIYSSWTVFCSLFRWN